MAIAVGIGSNTSYQKSSPFSIVQGAVLCLSEHIGVISDLSRVWQSPAWPLGSGPGFLNAVVLIQSDMQANDVLARLLMIEEQFGRVRDARNQNAPRTLDLDIIDHHGQVIDQPDLTVPHPRMHERAFVLGPLLDVTPDWHHPVTNALGHDLLTACAAAQNATPTNLELKIPIKGGI